MNAHGGGKRLPPRLITRVTTFSAKAFSNAQALTLSGPGDALLSFWIMFDAASKFKIYTPTDVRSLILQGAANTPVQMDFGPYGLYPVTDDSDWQLTSLNGAAVNIVAASFVFSSSAQWAAQALPV